MCVRERKCAAQERYRNPTSSCTVNPLPTDLQSVVGRVAALEARLGVQTEEKDDEDNFDLFGSNEVSCVWLV